MKGKMRTLYGIYKKHGRDAFLDAAKDYSAHVRDTVKDTLAEMESRWYDGGHTMTEAEKMVDDYNHEERLLHCDENRCAPLCLPAQAVYEMGHLFSEPSLYRGGSGRSTGAVYLP